MLITFLLGVPGDSENQFGVVNLQTQGGGGGAVAETEAQRCGVGSAGGVRAMATLQPEGAAQRGNLPSIWGDANMS